MKVSYFARHKQVQKALEVLEFMNKDKVKPNIITWNVLIDAFCKYAFLILSHFFLLFLLSLLCF